jgi:ubiquitin-conjugating enzyme E2 O
MSTEKFAVSLISLFTIFYAVSLLGTWNGKGSELWSPNKSNILQVLLSIQGLILGTREPFFLEAG